MNFMLLFCFAVGGMQPIYSAQQQKQITQKKQFKNETVFFNPFANLYKMSEEIFLFEAIRNNLAKVKKWVAQGVDINSKQDFVNPENSQMTTDMRPLHMAVAYGHKEIVAELLQVKDIQIDAVCQSVLKEYDDYMTPLTLALSCGKGSNGQGGIVERTAKDEDYEAIVALLLEKQASLSKVGNSIEPLACALRQGTPQMVKMLLNAGAVIKTNPGRYGATDLSSAMGSENVEKLRLVLDAGESIEGPVYTYYLEELTPLQYLVLYKGSARGKARFAMIEELLYRGARTDVPISIGKTFNDLMKEDPLMQQAFENAEKRKQERTNMTNAESIKEEKETEVAMTVE